MKTNRNWLTLWLLPILSFPTASEAQEKVEAKIGADLVSEYVWRGQNLGNASIQPAVSVAYRGLSLNAWGSVGITSEDTKEFDLTLGYSHGGFSVSVTDYWFNTQPKYFEYDTHHTSHVFEAQLGYDFGFLAANWYTNIGGADGVNKDGKRAYSSYVSLSAPFNLGGLEWSGQIGATPWATSFYASAGGFAVCEVSLKASKELRMSNHFSIPVFAKAIWNPASEDAHLVVGMSF